MFVMFMKVRKLYIFVLRLNAGSNMERLEKDEHKLMSLRYCHFSLKMSQKQFTKHLLRPRARNENSAPLSLSLGHLF